MRVSSSALVASAITTFWISGGADAADQGLRAPSDLRRGEIMIAQATPNSSLQLSGRSSQNIGTNTVTIMSGEPNGADLLLAYDMSKVLDDGKNLRIIPMVGNGGTQNIKDLLYLRSVDMAIVQSDGINYYNKLNQESDISARLRYVTRLYDEQMHLLADRDFNKIKDLRNEKVSFGEVDSNTQVSSRLIFEALNIPVEEVNMPTGDAVEALRRGEIAAVVTIAGKPAGQLTALGAKPREFGLIEVPYEDALRRDYRPAALTHDEYPDLIPAGQTVKTISVGTVLAVFNWASDSPRYLRVAKFTEALFENFDKFLDKSRHPKWEEVDLTADVPGWERFGAAKQMLDKMRLSTAPGAEGTSGKLPTGALPSVPEFEADPDARKKLFRRFMDWYGEQRKKD